jgi:hypothetical protein
MRSVAPPDSRHPDTLPAVLVERWPSQTAAKPRAYFPVQFGARFCANAAAPSRASCETITWPTNSCCLAHISSSLQLRDSTMTCLETRTASGPLALILRRVRARRRSRGFDHAVDEADLVAALRRDEVAGQRQFHRDARRDLARQAHKSAGGSGEPALGFRDAELRLGVGDEQIAGDRELHPARQRIAIDRGDQRLLGRGFDQNRRNPCP